jgi:hypothetical protein
MTSVSSILNGAFGLVRTRPLAVLAWCGCHLAVTVGSALYWLPFQSTLLEMGTNPGRSTQELGALFLGIALFGLGALALQMVLITAAYRAILHPDKSGFAYLRFGVDELLEIVLAIVMIVGFYALIFGGLVAIILGATFVAVLGTAGKVLGILLGILLGIAFLCLCIWLAVRLCLAFPLVVLRHRLAIGEAWRLSRGNFWTLFGAFIVVAVLYIVCVGVIGTLTAASYLSTLMSSGGFDPGGKASAVQQAAMIRQLTAITPLTVIGWVLSALVGGVFIALNGGATATAVRDLTVNDDELARRFE